MRQEFEELLIGQCAPTLVGLKPANLFRYCAGENETVQEKAAYWQRELARFGLSLRIVKECPRTNSFLIYMYRKNWMEEIVERGPVRRFLKRQGYEMQGGLEALINQLSDRLCMERDFPHEIGVFLGYPLKDVIGFIEYRGEHYTCCGYWKVYGDPKEAQERFDAYRSCTAFCRARFEEGTPIIQLITAA